MKVPLLARRFTWSAVALPAIFAACCLALHGAPGVTANAAEIVPQIDRTKADCGLQAAIDAAAEAGGGVVQIPEGIFPLRRGLLLRSGVTLAGAGIDRTVLTPARRTARLDIVRVEKEAGHVWVRDLPVEVRVGTALVACRQYPPAWAGHAHPAFVIAIDRTARMVELASPFGLGDLVPERDFLAVGDAAALERDIRRGDTEIHLKDASLFQPGDELALGAPPNESLLAHAFVRDVRGNVLLLEEPVQIDFPAWPAAEELGNIKVNALVWALFPLVHGANLDNAGIRDLTVQGHGFQHVGPMQTRYTLSGIHLYRAVRVEIERVAVRDWPSDGISLQAGSDCRVAHCEVSGCLGNGLHPGTGLTDSVFEHNRVYRNGAGLYFCWHNRRHIVRGNALTENRGGGITGLGNPGDRENRIERNRIAGNGGPGIQINGGLRSGNVICGNTIENNSQEQPGKHPGIALYAAVEDAMEYRIEGNLLRDTQAEPTQLVGIEERHGKYRDKPTRADENLILDNRFSGHGKADVILAGEATRCEPREGVVVRRGDDADR